MTYQLYDFKVDMNTHINKKVPILLKDKSSIFKSYLFKLKIFQLNKRTIKIQLFEQEYFLFIKSNVVFLAKKLDDEKFDYIEIKDGLKFIRKMKLKKIFKNFG